MLPLEAFLPPDEAFLSSHRGKDVAKISSVIAKSDDGCSKKTNVTAVVSKLVVPRLKLFIRPVAAISQPVEDF